MVDRGFITRPFRLLLGLVPPLLGCTGTKADTIATVDAVGVTALTSSMGAIRPQVAVAPTTSPERPRPPARAMTEDVLLIGEWTFVPDVDRWAAKGHCSLQCGNLYGNKFGGLSIERRTSTGKRRVPLEFRDVGGSDAVFQRWIELLKEELASGTDDILMMMGEVDAVLVHDGVALEVGSPQWRDEYRGRLVVLLETLSASSRRVLWLDLPTTWPGTHGDAESWRPHREVQAQVLARYEPRIERHDVDPLLEARPPRYPYYELSTWFIRAAVNPVLCEAMRRPPNESMDASDCRPILEAGEARVVPGSDDDERAMNPF